MLNVRVGVRFNLPSSTYECRDTSVMGSIWNRNIRLQIPSISISGISAEEITSFVIVKSSNWRHWVRRADKHASSLQCPVCCMWPVVTVSSGSLAAAIGLMNETSDVLETLGQFLYLHQGSKEPLVSLLLPSHSRIMDFYWGFLWFLPGYSGPWGTVLQLGNKDWQRSFHAFLSSSLFFRVRG